VGINYPDGANGGIDIFDEPTTPETTSLANSGGGTRAHVAHHRDLGDAVIAIQQNAAKKGHDHSGDATNTSKGAKLLQVNTHQSADTDAATTSLHHTLGTGATQAAAGNHIHDYTALTGTPWRRVATTLPSTSSVPEGTVVYRESTQSVHILRGSAWMLTTMGKIPICRLRQTARQAISQQPSGTMVQWGTYDEDTFGYWTSGNPSAITVSEPGLYHVDAAVQWNESVVPDLSYVSVVNAGVETAVRDRRGLKGVGINQGYQQTASVSGYVRVARANDVLSLRVRHESSTLIDAFLALFDGNSASTQSRIDVVFIAP